MEYFSFLPTEIALDIFSRLEIELILECKLVSKTWRNHIRHPSLSTLHLDRLNHPSGDHIGKYGFVAMNDAGEFRHFEYNENHEIPIERIRRINSVPPVNKHFVIAGSCNGLICLTHWEYVYIWNPITKEYVILPKSDDIWSYGMRNFAYFGYVFSSNEYKVVAIYARQKTVEVHVYTLGSGNGWRSLGGFDSQFGSRIWNRRPGFLANEMLYWFDDESKMIATFDLAQEKFSEPLSPPPLPPLRDSLFRYDRIGVLNGFLFFAVPLDVKGKYNSIWLLKKKNDDADKKEGKEHQSLGWIEEFKNVPGTTLLAIITGGCVLTNDGSSLYIYDTQSYASERLVDYPALFHDAVPHRNTLISLKEIGEQDVKTMEVAQLETESSESESSESESSD